MYFLKSSKIATATVFLLAITLCAAACGISLPVDESSAPSSQSQAEPSEEVSSISVEASQSENSSLGESSSLENNSSQSEDSSEDDESSLPPVSSYITAEPESYTYNIPARYYSKGIENIVKRARQLYELRWMPLQDTVGFAGDYLFDKNIEIRGLPYAQPVFGGMYLCYGASIEKFLKDSKDLNSVFYRTVLNYGDKSTYYGIDCSAFVCSAWNTQTRMTTPVLVNYFGDYNGRVINNIQVGDAIVKEGEGAHAVLITGIKEDSNRNVIWIETTEQTPPYTLMTRYGDGEMYSLDEFNEKYFEDGFGIYRNTDFRDNVPYKHSCASPIDGERCEKCGNTTPVRSVDASVSQETSSVKVSCRFACNEDVSRIEYRVTQQFYGRAKYKNGDASLWLRKQPVNGEPVTTIDANTVITVYDLHRASDGEIWGMAKANGERGWFWLGNAELLVGTVEDVAPVTVSAGNLTKSSVDGFAVKGTNAEFSIDFSEFTENSEIIVTAVTVTGKEYQVGIIDVSIK